MAWPISGPESSWLKWMPGAVTSAWSGQVRQKSQTRPAKMLPGSVLTNSFGSPGAEASQAAQAAQTPAHRPAALIAETRLVCANACNDPHIHVDRRFSATC